MSSYRRDRDMDNLTNSESDSDSESSSSEAAASDDASAAPAASAQPESGSTSHSSKRGADGDDVDRDGGSKRARDGTRAVTVTRTVTRARAPGVPRAGPTGRPVLRVRPVGESSARRSYESFPPAPRAPPRAAASLRHTRHGCGCAHDDRNLTASLTRVLPVCRGEPGVRVAPAAHSGYQWHLGPPSSRVELIAPPPSRKPVGPHRELETVVTT
jgi:hypothetical protein